MGRASRMRRREAKQQAQLNSNTADSSSDSDNVCHDRVKNMFSFYVDMLIIETEIMDLYEKQFGYDPTKKNPKLTNTLQKKNRLSDMHKMLCGW